MRWVFSGVFGAFVVASVLAPLLASEGRLEAAVLYAAFRPFCHQQIERLWWLAGEPLAVCARCFGVYWGIVLGVLAPPRFGSARMIGAAAAVCLASWGLEAAGLLPSPPSARFATGLVLGLTVGCALAFGLRKGRTAGPDLLQ